MQVDYQQKYLKAWYGNTQITQLKYNLNMKMKYKLLEKLATVLLLKLLELGIKMLEELVKYDIDNDGKIGR